MSLILEYEIPFVLEILWPDFVLNMRHINRLSLSLETSHLAFYKYASKYLTGQRRVEFLIKPVFPYLLICAEFSKHLRKVSLNKGMLKCKTFIPTLSKLTRTCRRVLSWSHATQTYLSTLTLICSSGCFLFTVIAPTSLLAPADISFSLLQPVQTKPSTRMFSYHRHSPHKITCPYKQVFTFLCRSLQRPTRSQGHLLFTDISYTGLLAHTDAF